MNNITIELCAEDRARLDKLAQLLDQLTQQPTAPATTNVVNVTQPEPKAPAEAPETAPEALKAQPQENDRPPWEQPAEPTSEAKQPANNTEPVITLAQVQQKVAQLTVGVAPAKKAKVREIVKAYAERVSAIPEDKCGEVWAKLLKLEKEA